MKPKLMLIRYRPDNGQTLNRSFEESLVMKLIGYRYHAAVKITGYQSGTARAYGYEFYGNQKRFCNISSVKNPSSPIMIYGFGQMWSSRFDPDSTIFPGVARYILDGKTKKEVFKIVFKNTDQYTIVIGQNNISVHADGNAYTYFSGESKIASIEAIQEKCKWIPEGYYEYDDNWYFSADFVEQLCPEHILAILAFPMLKFGF